MYMYIMYELSDHEDRKQGPTALYVYSVRIIILKKYSDTDSDFRFFEKLLYS